MNNFDRLKTFTNIDVNHQKAPAEKKFLMAPLIAGALLKPAVVLPMVKPAMIGAAAGAVSGNLVANLNKQQDVEEDRTISVTISTRAFISIKPITGTDF